MKRIAAAVTVLAALATLLLWLGDAEPGPAAPAPETRQAQPVEPRRVNLPRPALPTRTSPEGPEAPAEPPPTTPSPQAPSDDTPEPATADEERRAPIPLPVPQDMTAVAINRAIRAVLPDMVTCLNAWGAADVTFTGDVALGFDVGPEGLTEVWVEDVDNVPAGPLTCLSGAIWEADWPPFQHDTTVRYPFQVELTADDDGAGHSTEP